MVKRQDLDISLLDALLGPAMEALAGRVGAMKVGRSPESPPVPKRAAAAAGGVA